MLLSKYISVFLIGMVELWAAIPAGFAFKLHPVIIAAISAAGATTSALLVLIIGEPLRAWLLKFKKQPDRPLDGRIRQVWDSYGIPGLCLIAPLLVGAHLGAAIGLTLGGSKKKIAVWMAVSCLLWSALFSAFGKMGLSLFGR